VKFTPTYTEAEAKIKIAQAEGNAQAMLTSAKAEAEANRMKQQTITPMLLQLEYINKWNGVLPTTQLGSGTNMMYNVK
jgi:regulator of protease activity HflC (stomatin/prohibitin superfamily)